MSEKGMLIPIFIRQSSGKAAAICPAFATNSLLPIIAELLLRFITWHPGTIEATMWEISASFGNADLLPVARQ